MRYFSAEQCQQLDQIAIQQCRIPGVLLMKRAGFQAFDWLRSLLKSDQRLLIVCGTGNNGGDGFIVAQYALLAGYDVELVLLGKPAKITGDASQAYQEWMALGQPVHSFSEADFALKVAQSDWIVDAIFGTGLQRAVGGNFALAMALINQAPAQVMALDIASGLSADTGQILGQAVEADYTATFIAPKLGLVMNDGPDCSGETQFFDLGLPEQVYQSFMPMAYGQSLAEFQFPKRKQNSHKGTYGTLAVVGGNHTMLGAIQLCGQAAMQSGAGLVQVFSRPEYQIPLSIAHPELMVFSSEQLADGLLKARACVIGPGLGQDAWASQLFELCVQASIPKVLDADALNLLAQTPIRQESWILTPHPAEAARLLHISTAEVQANRVKAIKALQQTYGGVVVLKGTGSLVFDGARLFVCTAGNSGMAVGGMGDVLAGVIGSLLAQGMALMQAACLGVQWHAEAGDQARLQLGERAVSPLAVIENLTLFE